MGSAVVLVGVLMALLSSCCAYDFYVGGRQGWVKHPCESYNSWAGRNRFQVHDTLIFKYKQGNDSVLVVTEADYNSCNVADPIGCYTDGNSVFQFNRSGPFYFISGAAGHCAQGQKLIVVVLATRTPIPSPPSAPAEPPYWPPPTPSLSPYPSPASAPSTPGNPPSTPLPPRPSSSASDLAVSKVSLGLILLMALGRALLV
ncbi:hypothetical protein OPV22_020392 [Ensete ventricosum]|uniref:Phytocyanin domain-containing protein n=1 Tax=Ensete ventricosum TaxID=4639 RepID=A0AAV8QMY7_ENSVE|nr:hypothetical protein OPV22_020392 [Ensete ventricosum]RZS01152.1 hypothetical protein BHM03_00030954 [Ensete ventricosum]